MTENINKNIITELCQNCDAEVALANEFKVQNCPSCGEKILPCNICEVNSCYNCPLEPKKCQNCKYSSFYNKDGLTCDNAHPEVDCVNRSEWTPIFKLSPEEEKELAENSSFGKTTQVKIAKICNNLKDLLQYKSLKYGDSALNPFNLFSKLTGEEAIKIRIDDKISRIKNCQELRKNDVCDLIGYLILLCIIKGWLSFSEFMD